MSEHKPISSYTVYDYGDGDESAATGGANFVVGNQFTFDDGPISG